MDSEFKAFLEEHNALEAYEYNREHGETPYYDRPMPALDDLEPLEYIYGAFAWGVTNQGHPFWRDLHYKWKEALSNAPQRELTTRSEPTITTPSPPRTVEPSVAPTKAEKAPESVTRWTLIKEEVFSVPEKE